ncbi:hypothetical protein SAMN02745166_02199 [Prosthecobacter debontii]|uniref:Uncharacterized protein n=1 Tax=Prosthecobacter debontii TaxID=48467 RepID=A0A1T4XZC8_9BACT|nr:hypothetical protein [Prosthecobacter debontii]SKA94723.1 hypothetical protein SAMN02745166_02199 [Prosthecobacter debontii]
MRIATSLVQHYFLEVDPTALEAVYETLTHQPSLKHADEWRLFSWLDRPAIWAIRSVRRTSGLDLFLFDDHGLAGVTDVAELINFPMTGDEPGALLPDWETFSARLQGPGVLCATFIWPDWDTLYCPDTWGGQAPPTRSEILEAFRGCLIKALPNVQEAGLLSTIPPLLLTASAGDANLILYSWTNDSTELDALLLALSVMETDALAMKLGRTVEGPQWPVCRATQTEMALDLHLHLEAREAARSGTTAEDLSQRLDACFTGKLFAEVGLARGRGSLSALKDGLKKNAPGWEERAVFGGEDLVLAAEGGRALSFGEIIHLISRLEVKADHPGFPRRSSLHLGVMEAVGRTSDLTATCLYGVPQRAPTTEKPPASFTPSFASVDLHLVRECITNLSNNRWREDVRIIERMVERCVTLQKSPSLSREIRHMTAQALERIVRCSREIHELENALKDLIQKEEAIPTAAIQEKAAIERQIEEICIDIRMKRNALLDSGMAMDQAFSHHSKGVVALLLHPASQARGSEHIGSEVGLSLGMGAMFQSAAQRMLEALPEGCGDADQDNILNQLKDSLRDMQYPTVYASHEQGFSIKASMALLRIPRWALWYPSASCHLMHEFGHTLASIGTLSYLLRSVLYMLGGQGARNSATMQAQLDFLTPLLDHKKKAERTCYHFITNEVLIPNEDGEPPKVQPTTSDEMEEIACDIVSRSLAYPPGPEWDRRWLLDTFEYILPFAGRNEPDTIETRLLRLLSAFIAIRLLRQGIFEPDSARLKTLRQIQTEMSDIAIDFGFELAQWQDKLTRQQYPLPPYVLRGLAAAIDRLINLVNAPVLLPRQANDLEGAFLYSSIVITLALSVPPVEDKNEVSGYKATQIWGRLIDVNRLQNSASPDTDESAEINRIVEALSQNSIPSGAINHIEYLPSLLAKHYEGQGNRVPPAARVALSFYLYNNYKFNDKLNLNEALIKKS